jgi:hypothetical protein
VSRGPWSSLDVRLGGLVMRGSAFMPRSADAHPDAHPYSGAMALEATPNV